MQRNVYFHGGFAALRNGPRPGAVQCEFFPPLAAATFPVLSVEEARELAAAINEVADYAEAKASKQLAEMSA